MKFEVGRRTLKMLSNEIVIRWSKRCSDSECKRQWNYWGELVKKNLSVRVHHCSKCGLNIDRDLNAARNNLALGLQSLRESPR